MPRLWPALDAHPSPGADPEDLQGMILAALDDASISAVQELPAGWRFFFSSPGERDEAMALLHSRWPEGLALAAVDVSDEDWARRSQENIGPVRVGRITIAPPWAAGPGSPAAGSSSSDPAAGIQIVIQPSMGFGTGHHATTRLCTALMQQIDLVGRRVLDVGTGSGVLALVASRLGAGTVVGVDDDGDALESARENLELNRVTAGVQLRQADFRSLPDAPFDVVLANLTGGLLIRGVSRLVGSLAAGGLLILSGITLEEDASVREVFDAHLTLRTRLEEDGWVGLLYERTA